MKQKAFFVIFERVSLKEIFFFLKGESPKVKLFNLNLIKYNCKIDCKIKSNGNYRKLTNKRKNHRKQRRTKRYKKLYVELRMQILPGLEAKRSKRLRTITASAGDFTG